MAGDDVGQAVARRTEVDFVVLKHEVHKSAKRARYVAESAVPVSDKPATRLPKRMEPLQDILGEHQDSVTAQSLPLELTVVAQGIRVHHRVVVRTGAAPAPTTSAAITSPPCVRRQPPGLGAGPNKMFGSELGGSKTRAKSVIGWRPPTVKEQSKDTVQFA